MYTNTLVDTVVLDTPNVDYLDHVVMDAPSDTWPVDFVYFG